MSLIWRDPPERLDRADEVLAELKARPDEWALVAENQQVNTISPWYLPLCENSECEVRRIPLTALFLSHEDVYIRYVAESLYVGKKRKRAKE